MSNSKVVWSEGMFLQPQHFQQQDRYFEGLVEGRCHSLIPYPWGLSALKLDEPQLRQGKIGLSLVRGIFEDGTPFNLPHEGACPQSLVVPAHTRDQVVYLLLPSRRPGMDEVTFDDDSGSFARYSAKESSVRDSVSGRDMSAVLRLGQPRLRLALESEALDAFECLGVARVDRVETDKQVVLDEGYIPPALDAHASSWLTSAIREIYGSLQARGDALAAITSGANRSTVAQSTDILMLQTMNRYQPLFSHLCGHHSVHPESLYRIFAMLAGELATFRAGRRCATFDAYQHDDLAMTFQPIVDDIRRSLAEETKRNAISISVERRKYGFWTARVEDRLLLKNAMFILSVNSRLSPEVIRQRFPAVVQIGPTEQIGHLADHSLPGIRLHPLASLPPALPYHDGSTYFAFDRSNGLWDALDKSGAIAFHVAEDFPDLRLDLWAMRE